MKNRFSWTSIVGLSMCLFSLVAQAHHGLDFLLVQTAHLPEQGEGYAFARADHVSEVSDETVFEPAALYAARDWMTLELHGHWAKAEGESTEFEALAPAAYFRFTPRGRGLAGGLSVEYEFAQSDGHADTAALAGLLGYETAAWVAAANVTYEKEKQASGEWGYAAGFRYNLNAHHGVGIEAAGSLESGGTSELLLSHYGTFSEKLTWNFGIGAGVNGGPDWTARTSLIWRFR